MPSSAAVYNFSHRGYRYQWIVTMGTAAVIMIAVTTTSVVRAQEVIVMAPPKIMSSAGVVAAATESAAEDAVDVPKVLRRHRREVAAPVRGTAGAPVRPPRPAPRPAPVRAPTGNPTCVPTLGPCVKTNDQFRAAWRNVRTKGNVMAFCAGTTTLTSANLDLTPFPDQSTLCCGAGPITVSSPSGTINTPCKVRVTGSQIRVTANDFTMRGLDLTRTTGPEPLNGGILSIVGNGTHRVTDSVFRNGRASYGGNVYIQTIRPGCNVYIDRSSFLNSTAGYNGGGLFIDAPYGGITVRIDKSTFFKTEGDTGGGVFVSAKTNAKITISNSRFTNCTTSDCCYITPLGAGFYVYVPLANRTVTIQNNVFNNNNADATGGAGYIEEGNGLVTLRNNRGTNNEAPICNGILLESSAEGNTCFDVTDTYP